MAAGQASRHLLPFREHRHGRAYVLPITLSPKTTVSGQAGHRQFEKYAAGARRDALHQLKSRRKAAEVKEFHVIPYPQCTSNTRCDRPFFIHRSNVDDDDFIEAMYLMRTMKNVRRLRYCEVPTNSHSPLI